MSAIESHHLVPEPLTAPAIATRAHLRSVDEYDVGCAYNGTGRHVKRAVDLAAFLVLLPLLLLALVFVGTLIKLTSEGPAIFKQVRIGKDGRAFMIRKFRTMHADAPDRLLADPDLHQRFLANDHKLPIEEDPRIAPFGRFLRRTSIDELPQLINVALGQMSLVGPRPVVPTQLADYGSWAGAYLVMKPGMTGQWQTAGRSDIHFPERAIIDAEYLESWSIGRDVIILLKTIPNVLRRTGAV
jgi:exopolysaccharide production protein ExoY